MNGPEKRLWARLRTALPRDALFFRIEAMQSDGLPDVHGKFAYGAPIWIELKAIEAAPIRASTPLFGEKHGLSRDQVNWHLDWSAAGGVSAIVGAAPAPGVVVFPGSRAKEFNAMTARDFAAHAHFTIGAVVSALASLSK